MYHYIACGLPRVYLQNGYETIKTPYGTGVTIHDVPGLHRALSKTIVSNPGALTGDEFRFLRHELELSQAGLAGLIGCDVQSIARWEKGKSKKVDPASDRLLRIVYRGERAGDKKLKSVLDMLRNFECMPPGPRQFIAEERSRGWHTESKSAAA